MATSLPTRPRFKNCRVGAQEARALGAACGRRCAKIALRIPRDTRKCRKGQTRPGFPAGWQQFLRPDIAGYSVLMGANEADTVRSLKEHQTVVLPMIKEHGGRIIDTAGDGILSEFGSVVNAVECAVAIQRVMAQRNADVEEARRLRFRIGNQGDVVLTTPASMATASTSLPELENLAEPGGIGISRRVYEDISGKMQLAFVETSESSNSRTSHSRSGFTNSRANSSRLRERRPPNRGGYSPSRCSTRSQSELCDHLRVCRLYSLSRWSV